MNDRCEPPFVPGERLTYRLRWNVVKAGETVLQVAGIEKRNGTKAFHFTMETRTSGWVDAVYRIRQRIDAYASLDMTRSLFYRKTGVDGHAGGETAVHFDWERREAVYVNSGRKQTPVPLGDQALDPLSVFFSLRTFDPHSQTDIRLPITDGKKSVVSRTRLVRWETIQVPAGRFDSFLLMPDTRHLRGVFAKGAGADVQVWLTADARRIPVRVKSILPVGSFRAELTRIEGNP